MIKIWKIINVVIFTAIVVFSIIVIASSLNIFGTRMFVVKSGSMEPYIHTGSVVISKKNTDYKVGDVLTFKVPNSKDIVTHRITEIRLDANKNTFYTVKGDTNNAPDPDPVSKDNVVGNVRFSIPYLGYLVAFIKTLPGLIIFIVIPATIIVYQEIGKIKDEIIKIRKESRKIKKKAKKEEIKVLIFIKGLYNRFSERLRQNILEAREEEQKNEK